MLNRFDYWASNQAKVAQEHLDILDLKLKPIRRYIKQVLNQVPNNASPNKHSRLKSWDHKITVEKYTSVCKMLCWVMNRFDEEGLRYQDYFSDSDERENNTPKSILDSILIDTGHSNYSPENIDIEYLKPFVIPPKERLSKADLSEKVKKSIASTHFSSEATLCFSSKGEGVYEASVLMKESIRKSDIFIKSTKDCNDTMSGLQSQGSQGNSRVSRVVVVDDNIIILKETEVMPAPAKALQSDLSTVILKETKVMLAPAKILQSDLSTEANSKTKSLIQTIYLFKDKAETAVFSYQLDQDFIVLDFQSLMLEVTEDLKLTKSQKGKQIPATKVRKVVQLLVVGKDAKNKDRISLQYVLTDSKKYKNILVSNYMFEGNQNYIALKTSKTFFQMAFVISPSKYIYFRYNISEIAWYDKIKESNDIVVAQQSNQVGASIIDLKFDQFEPEDEDPESTLEICLVKVDSDYYVYIQECRKLSVMGNTSMGNTSYRHSIKSVVKVDNSSDQVFASIQYNSQTKETFLFGLEMPEIKLDTTTIEINLCCKVDGERFNEMLKNSLNAEVENNHTNMHNLLSDSEQSTTDSSKILDKCDEIKVKVCTVLEGISERVTEHVKQLKETNKQLSEDALKKEVRTMLMKNKMRTILYYHQPGSSKQPFNTVLVWNENERKLVRYLSGHKTKVHKIDVQSMDPQIPDSTDQDPTVKMKSKPPCITWIAKVNDNIENAESLLCVTDCRVVNLFLKCPV